MDVTETQKPMLVYKKIYSVDLLHRKVSHIMSIKNRHFYTHITCSVEVLDGTRAEFAKSTE